MIAMRKIVTIALMAVLLAGCNGNKRQEADVDLIRNPRSAEGYDSKEKMPVITFDEDLHNFGRLSAGENISYSFHFRNTGNADLIISSASATCGCTVADYPRERIAPGKTGYVTISFKSQGMSGYQVKEVIVASNAQPARTKLRIMATVR